MGGQPSKPVEPTSHEKAVVERLRSLQMQDGHEVNGDAEKASFGPLVREAKGLPINVLQSWQADFLKDPKNKLALTALSSQNPKAALTSLPTEIADQQIYNVKIPFEGDPITNQRSSGRCWLFASTNVFRVALMKRYGLESFELSQAYLFYWDKLEKSNFFLEQIIDTAGEDLEGRLVQRLLGDLVSDGGQWDMVYNLVEKYGLVPQTIYPDSWNAMNTGVLNNVVKIKLREFALKLRTMVNSNNGISAAALSSAKDKMMREIQLIMTLLLGPPPSPEGDFTWQYSDKNGKAHQLKTNPKNFAKDIYSPDYKFVTSNVISSFISLVNDPRHDYLTRLEVSRLGNIVGGRGINYVNVDMATMKKVCISTLKAGIPIFFGSDVGQFSDSKSGIMDLELFNYDIGFNTSLLEMSKAQRLMTGESLMTHAMVLTAVHIDEDTGKPVRWRVQNSWGTTAGDKGWFVMSDAWMDEFVYQVVVDPRFCSHAVRDVLKKEAIVLPLWDPMGSLA
ncbi:peptidase C1B, bleomycin hydrolase [Dactylonectria macrodidyma]|uniref:Cysteine proteinase 1, mitochondrial n=1 Tax=Dactylonectria macrodidyma TaxID=307937 RepID=A0A9P9JMC6_9HYPO|nr:peptidase C1B, bleomycin hydrolase [Dactylonectria macrodidyma]